MVLHGSGLVRMGVRKVRIAQVRSVHISAAQTRSGQDNSGLVRKGKDRLGQHRSEKVRIGQPPPQPQEDNLNLKKIGF